jgi:hypothetical protein
LAASASVSGGLLINIDNGGALWQGPSYQVCTTPYDLSKCFFLRKASRAFYGKEDLLQLRLNTLPSRNFFAVEMNRQSR